MSDRVSSELHEQLIAVVSHDLRGPLSAIMTSATLLQHKLAKLPADAECAEPPGAKQIEVILRAVKQLDRRIGELLDVSAIEAGQLKLELAPHDIGMLLREGIEAERPAAAKHGLKLDAEIPRQAINIDCDRKRLRQAFSHLLENAVKFTPEGGSIEVRVEAWPEKVRVSVRDSGTGIAADELAHIFDRLKRAPNTGSRSAGLGLAITRGIIEAHGGSVSAASVIGRGSTFSFTLPVTSASAR